MESRQGIGDIEETANSSGSGAFFRWALPLAAAISLAVGGFWWWITLHQEASPLVRLRDGNGEVVIAANGRSMALRELPPALQDAIAEAFRTGKIPTAKSNDEASETELKAAEQFGHGSHLVLGVAKARAGRASEAADEFRALRAANPDAELPKRLLESSAALGQTTH